MTLAEIVVALAGLYLVPGVLIALLFVFKASRVDHRLRDSGRSVRLLLAPGVAAMWPIVLRAMLTSGGRVS